MLTSAVVGMGVGRKHAEAYQNHPSCRLKSICDFDVEKLDDLENTFPGIYKHEDVNNIIGDQEVNIVSVASYDCYHAEQIIRSLENGKHVMAEKPLCLNRRELAQIRETQLKYPDTKLSSNLVLRSNSLFREFRDGIDRNVFGDVFFIEGDYYWGRKSKFSGWRSKFENYSIVLGSAIHMVDLIMWLLETRPISVEAKGNGIATKTMGLQFNSFVTLLLKFENNIIAKVTGNGGCVHPHFHGLKIFGSERTAIHDLHGTFYIDACDSDFKESPIVAPYPEKGTREKVLHSFIDSILDPTLLPLVPEKDVYDVMAVCLAAETAMKTGHSVTIDYLF